MYLSQSSLSTKSTLSKIVSDASRSLVYISLRFHLSLSGFDM
ncbi:hypothetical protein MNB_SV-6-120 [hydrothermal vent metagenome]|uniref:Uncharacterized protein n=1 Tax=hydrothermal vent metagenome TaxID=652676 RepID=A0A1W1BW15_9ZZZZ